MELVGVDYSHRSTGLHWPDFNSVLLQRPWNELDLDQYAHNINNLLQDGIWISGFDLEVQWLAGELPNSPHVLAPSRRAVELTAKSIITRRETPGFQIPERLLLSDADLDDRYTFCRQHGWKVWLKGPYYEAQRVFSWSSLNTSIEFVSKTWATDAMFLQAHVGGGEESIAFAAHHGKLLDAAHMTKTETTSEGKTWAGRVTPVATDEWCALEAILMRLNWTGGGELEFVRDADGICWLLEWNPRFPAWIYGAAMAGYNLPALLVGSVLGISVPERKDREPEFVRVVLEIPTRSGYPLHGPIVVGNDAASVSKHPSGMPLLARRLQELQPRPEYFPRRDRRAPSALSLPDLIGLDLASLATPSRMYLPSVADMTFRMARECCDAISSDGLRVIVAYSVKTNPDPRLLRLAHRWGFWAETISELEVGGAAAAGFQPDRVVTNGPGKGWPEPSPAVAVTFCDSLEELRTLVANGGVLSNIVGVRLRPPNVASRFGISVESIDVFEELCRLVSDLPPNVEVGVHWHMASSAIGISEWWSAFNSIVGVCRALQAGSGREVSCLDIGGGWHPTDWATALMPMLQEAIRSAKARLPGLRLVILEPGKALSQACMMLAVRVLEIRSVDGDRLEAVVDGSIAELSQAHNYPHGVLRLVDSEWVKLGVGKSRLLGRLCMEEDVLASSIDIPGDVKAGDILLLRDAGAYDSSMAYVFGHGSPH